MERIYRQLQTQVTGFSIIGARTNLLRRTAPNLRTLKSVVGLFSRFNCSLHLRVLRHLNWMFLEYKRRHGVRVRSVLMESTFQVYCHWNKGYLDQESSAYRFPHL